MTTETESAAEVTTSQTERMAELKAQMDALQAQFSDAAKLDAEERQEQLDKERTGIINSIEDFTALRNPEAEDWERILNADCTGLTISYVVSDGEPPVVVVALTAKSAPRKATATVKAGSTGTRRDLLGEFMTLASPTQITLLEADKAMFDDGSKRGRQNGFMNKVVDSGDREFMPPWQSEHNG